MNKRHSEIEKPSANPRRLVVSSVAALPSSRSGGALLAAQPEPLLHQKRAGGPYCCAAISMVKLMVEVVVIFYRCHPEGLANPVRWNDGNQGAPGSTERQGALSRSAF